MSKLPPMPEPSAWLVSGGRTFIDKAYTAEAHAEQSVVTRKDGAQLVQLFTAAQLQADRLAVWNAAIEAAAKLCEDHAIEIPMTGGKRLASAESHRISGAVHDGEIYARAIRAMGDLKG